MKHIIIIAILVMFAGCKKEEMKGKLTFYNEEFTASARLYVDGKNMGSFQLSVEPPSCGDAIDGRSIVVEFNQGTEHEYWVVNNNTQYTKNNISVNSPCQIVKVEKK